MIGLASTTYSHLKTEDTDRVVTCALSVLARPDAGEEELAQQLKQVRAEKLAVAPGCATCVAKCGNTDDYDMERLWNGPDQVRSLKIRLFSGLKKTGRDAFKVIENGKGKDKHFQSIMDDLKDLTLQFRGSSNQRIIDVQKSLKAKKVIIWDKLVR